MKVINYRIELLEPALVTSGQGDPNSAVAFDYLPGSVLRGILIARYLVSKPTDASDDSDTLRHLFFEGTIRYLNGYPLDAENHPGSPVPASWHRAKGGREDTIFDLAIEAGDDKLQWQPVKEPFYTQPGRSVRLISPARNVAVHTQRTARFGRAMPKRTDPSQMGGKPRELLKDDEIPGAVYRYDALAAGQIFEAAIVCDNDADEQILRNLLKDVRNGRITLGGSRSGGYGQAKIIWISGEDADLEAAEEEEDEGESSASFEEETGLEAAEEEDEETDLEAVEEDEEAESSASFEEDTEEEEDEGESSASFEEETSLEAAEEDEGRPEGKIQGKLIVTLQSDVLLRDKRGQFAVDPELLRQVLSEHLPVELELEDAFLGTQVIGGFNRKWGLPLPQALAVSMGSVLVFKYLGHDSTLLTDLEARMTDLEARGIGERRAEGFGRIAFNRQHAAQLEVKKITPEKPGHVDFIIGQTEARDLAQLMVNRMLRKRLDERLLAAANRIEIANPPSNAQLSRLRGVVLEELRKATPDIHNIHRFIKGISERGSARRQFERSTLDGKEPLLRWLKDLLRYDIGGPWTMDDGEWNDLLRLNMVEVAAQIGDVEAKIDDSLRLEYVLRLINLVLAKAAKERGKGN